MKAVRDRETREFRLKRIRGMDDELKGKQHETAKSQDDWYGFCTVCGGRMIGKPQELLTKRCDYCGARP